MQDAYLYNANADEMEYAKQYDEIEPVSCEKLQEFMEIKFDRN